jgi:hypothetical protein
LCPPCVANVGGHLGIRDLHGLCHLEEVDFSCFPYVEHVASCNVPVHRQANSLWIFGVVVGVVEQIVVPFVFLRLFEVLTFDLEHFGHCEKNKNKIKYYFLKVLFFFFCFSQEFLEHI